MVGLRHLQDAQRSTGVEVSLSWEPFFLNNDMPEEGEDIMEHLAKKYGPEAAARFGGADNPLSRAGLACDPPIKFTNDRKIYPTVNCHALMEHLKGEKNDETSANKVMEIMFRRYFEEGQAINTPEVLQKVIDEADLPDKEAAIAAVGNKDLHQMVRLKDQEFKSKLRVSGVPFFIIKPNDGGRPTAFSGAQPADIIAEQLEAAADE